MPLKRYIALKFLSAQRNLKDIIGGVLNLSLIEKDMPYVKKRRHSTLNLLFHYSGLLIFPKNDNLSDFTNATSCWDILCH